MATTARPTKKVLETQLVAALDEVKAARLALQRAARPDFRQLSEQIASTMTVDRVHSIFTAAAQGDTREMWVLYRDVLLADGHIQTELLKRKLAVVADSWSVAPWNKKNAADVAASDFITAQLGDFEGWMRVMADALNATIWPVVVLRKQFGWSGDPKRPYKLVAVEKVEEELLDFRSGDVRIYRVDENGRVDWTTSDAPDPETYIVHRNHLLSLPDRFGGTMRSLIFWWLFSAMDRDWWMRFLDRFGIPFPVAKYKRGDTASKSVLREAFSWAKKIGGLVVDEETAIEIHQIDTAKGGAAFSEFYGIAQREKSKIILGQTLSATADGTGLGSGTADLQGDVRQDLRAADALLLGEMIRHRIFKPLCRLNGFQGPPPMILFGGLGSVDKQTLSTVVKNLKDAGFEPTDDGLDKIVEWMGFGLQRIAAPAAPGQQQALVDALTLALTADQNLAADRANQIVARTASADLARAFRGDLAPIRRIITLSTSADDLRARLAEFFPDWTPRQSALMLEKALTAFAGNAALASPFPTHQQP